MGTTAEKAQKRVKEIEEMLKKAKARAQRIEAATKAQQNKTARAERERKKYLVGAVVLEMMEKDASTNQRILEKLDRFLTRPNERELFGLSPLLGKQGQPAQAAQPMAA